MQVNPTVQKITLELQNLDTPDRIVVAGAEAVHPYRGARMRPAVVAWLGSSYGVCVGLRRVFFEAYTDSPLTVGIPFSDISFSDPVRGLDTTIPGHPEAVAGGRVEWGDGATTNFTVESDPPLAHTYAEAGAYPVTLYLYLTSDPATDQAIIQNVDMSTTLDVTVAA